MEKWTPEQLNLQAERAKSDAELIKKGAKYVQDKKVAEPRLEMKNEAASTVTSEYGKALLERNEAIDLRDLGVFFVKFKEALWSKLKERSIPFSKDENVWNLDRYNCKFTKEGKFFQARPTGEYKSYVLVPHCNDSRCDAIGLLEVGEEEFNIKKFRNYEYSEVEYMTPAGFNEVVDKFATMFADDIEEEYRKKQKEQAEEKRKKKEANQKKFDPQI